MTASFTKTNKTGKIDFLLPTYVVGATTLRRTLVHFLSRSTK
ncbi:MAG: hypothetical protein JWR87_2937 [Segetibacter sp.]|jgi:hypothetical protein|nr:hypothetical protein [Segetibacter sp.]